MGIPVKIRPLESCDWPWIQGQAKPVLCEDTQGIVATRGDQLVAAAVFDNWSANSCVAHIVLDDPLVLRWRFLTWAFRLVFTYNNRNLVTGLTPADNEKALKFNKHIGFREVYRIPEGHKVGIDYVLFEMTKDECRWLDLPMKRVA